MLVYEASHADDLDGSFRSTERFLDRLDAYTQRDGFELVVAYADDSEPVGLAFGFALPETTGWWRGSPTLGLRRPDPPTGTRIARRWSPWTWTDASARVAAWSRASTRSGGGAKRRP